VVERHRDADPVVFGVVAQFPDKEPVVEDVVVRKRRALGEARRAGGVLDVDRVVRRKRGLLLREQLRRTLPSLVQQRVPEFATDQDDVLELRRLRFRGFDHARVVGRLELLRRDHHLDPGLVQHELQLMRAVCRVDVDQDRADLRRRVLRERPLGTVRRPDADAVALRDTEIEQPERERVDLGRQLAVRPALARGPVDERVPVRERQRGAVEVVADGVPEQRDVGDSRGVAGNGGRVRHGAS